MKKVMALIIASALLLSMSVGCGSKNDDTSSDAPEIVSSNEVKFNEQGCIDMLNRIFDVQPGTAGSSLKAGLVAVDVLNWTEVNEADTETIAATVQKFYDNLDAEQKSDFKQCFALADGYANDIISGSNDLAGFLKDSGANIKSTGYSADKYKAFADAVKSVIG